MTRPRVIASETKKGGSFLFLIDGVQVDMYHALPEQWGAMCLFLTGNAQFNIRLRLIAKKHGFKLNEKGLWSGENQVAGKDERQMFDVLGLEWLEPVDRSW